MTKYRAASVTASIEVESFEDVDDERRGYGPHRTTKLQLRESFSDDAGLDKAIDSLAATIREAARR